ncbi:hypothetical protein AMTRI_Chr09g21610 [Amborella trichopoda]
MYVCILHFIVIVSSICQFCIFLSQFMSQACFHKRGQQETYATTWCELTCINWCSLRGCVKIPIFENFFGPSNSETYGEMK